MVAKGNIVTAAREIEEALNEFVLKKNSAKVSLIKTEWGSLRALIGSGGFAGVGLGLRQEMVWDYLREKVSDESLGFLSAVYPMDLDEWDRNVSEI